MYKVTKDTQFAILGLGKFGRSIAEILFENDFHVLCCDKDEIVVHEMAQYATHVMEVDLTDEAAVDSIGLGNFDVVIVAVGNFEISAMTTMIAKEAGANFVLAKANDSRQKKILERTGADHVVLPEKEIGARVAYHFVTNNPIEHIYHSDKFDLLEVKPEPHWIGKSLAQLDLRRKDKINVLAILRDDKLISVLNPDTTFEEEDEVIILKSEEM